MDNRHNTPPDQPTKQPMDYRIKNLIVGLVVPVVFVALWSTGFMVAKFSLQYAEPVGLLALRFGIAAVLLIAIRLLLSNRRRQPLSLSDIAHAAVAGVLMQAVYLGGVFTGIALGIGAIPVNTPPR